jgi:MFS-type transporter involved in bile tolerance (Atg22 family)
MSGSVTPPAVGARRTLASWIAYDMAAHGYTLIVSGVGFPLYFASFIAGGRGNARHVDKTDQPLDRHAGLLCRP